MRSLALPGKVSSQWPAACPRFPQLTWKAQGLSRGTMCRSLTFLFCVFFAATLQGLPPAMSSPEAFMTEIANKKWECSYTAYPELRFLGDKIEALSAGKMEVLRS